MPQVAQETDVCGSGRGQCQTGQEAERKTSDQSESVWQKAESGAVDWVGKENQSDAW